MSSLRASNVKRQTFVLEDVREVVGIFTPSQRKYRTFEASHLSLFTTATRQSTRVIVCDPSANSFLHTCLNNYFQSVFKMEWSNEEILEFIGLYEKHPVLWNPKHPGHKNRNALSDAWQNIAREISIEVSVEVLRKKKESLMATYRTLAKKVRDSEITGSGANEVYVPSWFAYEAIDRFIRATGKKIPSLTSQESQLQESIDETSQNEQGELNVAEEQANESSVDVSETNKGRCTNFTLPQSRATNKRKGTSNTVEVHIGKHLKQASDALTTLVSSKSGNNSFQDAPALYGQLLAAKLRRLPQRTQVILQNKIDNLVFQAELNEIDSTNVTRPKLNSPISSPSNSNESSSTMSYTTDSQASYPAEGNGNPNLTSEFNDASLVSYYSTANEYLNI